MAAEKNLARHLSVNFTRLTREVLIEFPRSGFDLDRTIARLRNKIWGDDLTTEQKQALLFCTEGYEDLPMAVLAARHLSLPADRIPDSQKALTTFCRWLLSREDNETLIDMFVRGWAENETPFAALRYLVDELWAIRELDRDFFEALVRGRHASALEMISERQLPAALDNDRAIRLLSRMALIWAAFDCQSTAARARRSITRPMGWLVRGPAARIKASTLITVFRPLSKALEKFIDGYRNADDAIAREKPRSRLSATADIRRYAEADAHDREAREGEFAFDAIVEEVAARSARTSDPFLRQAQKDQTESKFGNRYLSQSWYAGLSPLQIVGLASMRLAQLEQQLAPLLRKELRRAQCAGQKPQFSMPGFHDVPLRPGWKGRSRAIADAIRGAVLRDVDYHSVRKSRAVEGENDGLWQGSAHDDRFIASIDEFFACAGRSEPATGVDAWRDRRLALKDLDLATEQRFSSVSDVPRDTQIGEQLRG